MPTHQLTTKGRPETPKEDICLFAQTNFRNQMRRFGIKTDDRRRHMYVIGKTGMGKTTLLENMVLQDIYNGHGVGVVDPHGDFAEKIINYIPPHRINDVVYFNPADVQYPIGFNILEVENEEQKHLVAAGLMAVFKKIWPDVWSARMEYILNNTLLALLDYEGSTLLGINRLLADKKFRRKVLRKLKDPVIKSFWNNEFANYEPRYQKEAVAPIQNKIGQFLSASVIRNMVAQVKSTINVREIMDSKKILIMNLSKGRIGEDNSRLLGGMLITEIQLAAMSRVDIPESERKDFFLYVDEFQNFATPSFANILSEARKYRLSLIMAHQYVAQLDEVVADAVFGNVGSMVTFRVGAGDAESMEKEYAPTFTIEDIVNLPKFQIFLKLMIDGVASQPFSAATMPPIGSPTGSAEKVIKVSRERYGKNRDVIEDKITRWSGMEIADDGDDDTGENGDAKKSENKKSKDSKKSDAKKQEGKKEKKKDGGGEPKRQKESKGQDDKKSSDQEDKKTNLPAGRQGKQESKKAKEDEESDSTTSEAPVDTHDEPVVHLSDLLPKAQEETKVDSEEAEDVIAPQPLEFKDLEETVEEFVEEAKKEEEKEELAAEHKDQPGSDADAEKQSDEDKPKKRKRKRKRKRKKKTENEQGGAEEPSARDDKAEKHDARESKETSSPEMEDREAKTIRPDEIVTFDTDTDDDDAWRSDR